MPFDPTKPAFGSPDSSAEMRSQFNALNDKIDAIPAGPQGPPGPPFADAVVDSVTTLPPGDSATVGTNFDGIHVRFTFGIPRGTTGGDGAPGPQGVPGEVTNAALATALSSALATAAANSSANSNGVAALGLTVSDPPTQTEMQAIASKLDELIAALRR